MKKYKIIYADPPWRYDDPSKNRGGAERHYRTSNNAELGLIDVSSISDDDCVLFMWATFPKIREALELINLWGFEYKTNAFTWVKKNKISDSWFWGMGRWTRSNAEVCLLATKGKPKRVGKGVHSVVDSPVMRHSQKPDIVRDRIIELMGDLPRIELFARSKAVGWDVFGDQVERSVEIKIKSDATGE